MNGVDSSEKTGIPCLEAKGWWDNSRISILPIDIWVSAFHRQGQCEEIEKQKNGLTRSRCDPKLMTLQERDLVPSPATLNPRPPPFLQNKDNKLFCLVGFQHPGSLPSQGEYYQRITPWLINSPNQDIENQKTFPQSRCRLANAVLSYWSTGPCSLPSRLVSSLSKGKG